MRPSASRSALLFSAVAAGAIAAAFIGGAVLGRAPAGLTSRTAVASPAIAAAAPGMPTSTDPSALSYSVNWDKVPIEPQPASF